MYIKYLQRIAERHGLRIKLYADDSQLYISFHPKFPSEFHDVIRRTEECLAEIKSWMSSNFMKLNETKTELLVVGKPQVLRSNMFDISLNFGGSTINITECKDDKWTSLGIKLDSSMTMERQINSVKQKCYWTLHNFRAIGYYLDTETKAMMVIQLVIMRLDYCNVIYINLPKRLLKKLQSVLNSCIRYIYSIKDQQEDLIPYYKKAHILPIPERISFKVCLMCFKIVNGLAPPYMSDLVSIDGVSNIRPATRDRPQHDTLKLKVPPLPKTLIGARRFANQAPIIWNALPLSIRSSCTSEIFKKSLKTHLFNSLDQSNS